MKQELQRQYRRLAFAALAGAMAGLLRYGPTPLAVVPAVTLFVLGILFILYVPRQRRLTECLALAVVLVSPLPYDVQTLMPLVIGGALFLHMAVYGNWSTHIGPRFAMSHHAAAHVPAPPARIWSALVPGEGHPDDYWNRRLIDYMRDPDDPDTVYLRMRRPSGNIEEMTLTFIDRDPQRSCRYMIEGDPDGGMPDATRNLTITPENGGCKVEMAISFDGLPLNAALSQWFDLSYTAELANMQQSRAKNRGWKMRFGGKPPAKTA